MSFTISPSPAFGTLSQRERVYVPLALWERG